MVGAKIWCPFPLDFFNAIRQPGNILIGSPNEWKLFRCVTSMPNDPVCYTQVDEGTKFRTTHKGREYYFCTGFCQRIFEEEPEKYARLAGDLNPGNDLSC